jgi:hypothetical protein
MKLPQLTLDDLPGKIEPQMHGDTEKKRGE